MTISFKICGARALRGSRLALIATALAILSSSPSPAQAGSPPPTPGWCAGQPGNSWCCSVYPESTSGCPACAEVGNVPGATNHIIYLHGRQMSKWPCAGFIPRANLPAGWDNVAPVYDGSARLSDASANNAIKNALTTYCRNGHTCVVFAFSAGMPRYLQAAYELQMSGPGLPGLAWVEATASATGTPVAAYVGNFGWRLLAKLFGKYAAIDWDIIDTQWYGGDKWHLQNASTRPVYNPGAGLRNQCIKVKIFGLTLFKLCGNSKMYGSKGDGAVPVAASCGWATRYAYDDCCTDNAGLGKFQNRILDSLSPCSHQLNHEGMFAKGIEIGAQRLAGYAHQFATLAADVPESAPEPECIESYAECDLPENGSVANLHVYQTVAAAAATELRPATYGSWYANKCITLRDFKVIYRNFGRPGYRWIKWSTAGGWAQMCITDPASAGAGDCWATSYVDYTSSCQ